MLRGESEALLTGPNKSCKIIPKMLTTGKILCGTVFKNVTEHITTVVVWACPWVHAYALCGPLGFTEPEAKGKSALPHALLRGPFGLGNPTGHGMP